MKKDRKISYLINAAGILVLFLLFYAVFQSGVLGIRTTYIKGICTTACYTIVMVTSLNLLVGFMGEFSLGHAGFMSVGAYMSAVFTTMMADSGIPELRLFIMALLIGGTGSLTGSIIGAAFLSALPEVMRQFANYRILAYSIVLVLVMIFPLPDTDQKAAGKKEGLIDSLKHTHFSVESIAMILIGFTCTGTFQLWLNCAQNFAKEVVGWADPSIMQTYYSMGTLLALIVTALLTRKIKDVRFIAAYPAICLAALIVVLIGKSQPLCIAGAFIIGWAGAGGLLQIATSVCNMLFPKIKGTVTALVMIASSLCNYTILTAASKMTPSGVMTMNIVLTAIGVLLGVFVNIRYAKMVELASAE